MLELASNQRRNKKYMLIVLILWTAIIFILSTLPSKDLEMIIRGELKIDKLGHFILYLVHSLILSFTCFLFFSKSRKWIVIIVAFIMSSSYGILMEIVQKEYFPSRNFDIFDIVANIIGAFTGVLIFNYFNKKRIYE